MSKNNYPALENGDAPTRLDDRPKHMNKWEYRDQPSYKLLTHGVKTKDRETQKLERRESNKYKGKTLFSTVMASLICIVIGLAVGCLLLLVDAGHFQKSVTTLFTSGFSSMSTVLIKAGPLLFCALSVGFCYKCGMFNIGGSGQYMFGGMLTLVCALNFQLPWYVSILVSAVGGALIGSIPGLLKAFFNINEVITAIMLNWLSLFVCDLIYRNVPSLQNLSNQSYTLNYVAGSYPDTILPKIGDVNIGIILGIVVAIVLAVVLFKTTFGYKLRAVGFSRNASRYAGINDKADIIVSFIIAGALSGIGGSVYYLAGNTEFFYSITSVASAGFDAIPIALLANNNPIGIIVTTLFIAYLKVTGSNLQAVSSSFTSQYSDIIIAVILYCSGFAKLFYNLFFQNRKGEKKDLRKDKEEAGNDVKQTPETSRHAVIDISRDILHEEKDPPAAVSAQQGGNE